MIKQRLKIFALGLLMLSLSVRPALADDIFDEITADLDKPATPAVQPPYWRGLWQAVTNKNSYILYKELYLSGRDSGVLNQIESRDSLGFLLFGTFSSDRGQLGDLNIQFRLTAYGNQFAGGEKMPRAHTPASEALVPELHNAYFRLRVLPPLLTFRAGHFYVPFGLQPWIDTHGTLLQGPAMEFIGAEQDWGVGLEGQGDLLEYQLGLQRGSGMALFSRANNYLLAGKISTPRTGQHLNEWLGLSYLTGRVYDPMGVSRLQSVEMDAKDATFPGQVLGKQRLGLDAQKIFGPLQLRGELALGKDAYQEDMQGEFAEIKYALDKSNRLTSYLQLENLIQNTLSYPKKSETTLRGGLLYGFSANYNLQLVVSHDLEAIMEQKDTWVGLLFYGQVGGGLLKW